MLLLRLSRLSATCAILKFRNSSSSGKMEVKYQAVRSDIHLSHEPADIYIIKPNLHFVHSVP